MVSLLHHPLGNATPAYTTESKDNKTELGLCPHQIRGFVSAFDSQIMTGMQYTCCVACSEPIKSAYLADPWPFVLSVLNTPDTLEDVSGITKMKADAPGDMDWDSGEFGEDGEDDF